VVSIFIKITAIEQNVYENTEIMQTVTSFDVHINAGSGHPANNTRPGKIHTTSASRRYESMVDG
jgi:hypothetical protein